MPSRMSELAAERSAGPAIGILCALIAAGVVAAGLLVIQAIPGGAHGTSPGHALVQGAAPLQESVRLTVTSGSGGGIYQPGDTVYVEPNRMPDMRVFDRWDGDIPTGSHQPVTARAHMTFTMPARDLIITGTLRPAPLWALRSITANGAAVHYQPPAPSHPGIGGALVLLHDAGQDAEHWLRSTESRLLQRAAVARGHGLLVLESTDRSAKRWDTEHTGIDDNADLLRLLDATRAAGLGGAPLVLVGVGQGGDFADLAARAFLPLSSVHVVGTILVGSAGIESDRAAIVPTMFTLTERDDPDIKTRAMLQAWTMQVQGTPVDVVELGPRPMYPRRFWRIDGLNAADSERAHQVLTDAGILGADGWVATDPTGLEDPGMPDDLAAYWPHLREQLVVGWAGHGFSTHATEAMLDFAESEWGLPVLVPTAEPTRRAYAAHIDVEGGSKGKGPFMGTTDWYSDLDVVPIWADPDPAGEVFDAWTGTTGYLADPGARHTTAHVTGVGCCRLVATYRPSPEWQPVLHAMDGRRAFYHVPPDPAGLVFFFHGVGGSAADWLDERHVENWLLLRDTVARGYAVAVTESGDRQAGRWSQLAPGENPDMDHVARLQAELVSSGQLPDGLRTFGIGMSDGGAFVTRAADALGWQGAAVYAAACRRTLAETTTVPVIWLLAENDRRVSNQDAYACFQRLDERGMDTELHVTGPSPVYPERFWRVPGVTADGSRAAYDSVLAARLLDRLDCQLLSPFESSWRSAIAAAGTVPLAEAGSQLDVAFAEHQFFSDLNSVTLRFFDRQRGATPVHSETPGSATPTPTGTPTSARGEALLPIAWTGR